MDTHKNAMWLSFDFNSCLTMNSWKGETLTQITLITLQTPLHLAIREGHFDCVQTLMEYGARTDIKNSRKKTAEMLLADPENARRLELAKSRSMQKKKVAKSYSDKQVIKVHL